MDAEWFLMIFSCFLAMVSKGFLTSPKLWLMLVHMLRKALKESLMLLSGGCGLPFSDFLLQIINMRGAC